MVVGDAYAIPAKATKNALSIHRPKRGRRRIIDRDATLHPPMPTAVVFLCNDLIKEGVMILCTPVVRRKSAGHSRIELATMNAKCLNRLA